MYFPWLQVYGGPLVSFRIMGMPPANPPQLYAHQLNSFPTAMIIFEASKISWFILWSIFDHFYMISDKRSDRYYYEYYEWTDRYYEWTDEYYE